MKILWDLFITFAKMGAVTFGGGYAMLPLIQRTIVEKKEWASEEEILDYYAIGQCTPGIIAVNTATFVGYKQGGIFGGISATAGMVFPSLLIISVIAAFLENFADNPYVNHAFNGIRVCVGVLILNAVIKLWKSAVKDLICAIIALIVLGISTLTSVSPVLLVILAGVFGLAVGLFPKERSGGRHG